MLGLHRFSGGLVAQLFRRAAYSSNKGRSSATATAAPSAQSNEASAANERLKLTDEQTKKPKSGLVAAAFESLQKDTPVASVTPPGSRDSAKQSNIDERIVNAKTVNGLLSITEMGGSLSRKHALKIVSILADWSSMNRVNLSEFENDTRFLRLCRMLGRTMPKNGIGTNNNGSPGSSTKAVSGFRTDDLNMVLGVAGDDEAAKLIASISLAQMVKVMSALAQRRRRSTPLLRSLAFNISSATEHLDLKQCADVLYSMAVLNFQDSVLAAKLCADIQTNLPKLMDKSAVVGSILTSLGILRYRDLDILEALTQWTLNNSEACRPQDLSALFLTSSILNFRSTNIADVRQKLVKALVREDFPKSADWLNHVWALALLGLAENHHLESVLSTEFQAGLQAPKGGMTPTLKMKLLNLNAYAELMAIHYNGPLLNKESKVYELPLMHSKSKKLLLNAMLDALKSLLPANNHVQSGLDSRMGFLIDAVCAFDTKRNPLPLDKDHPEAIRIALMVIDYHDICHGSHRSTTGITTLMCDLLERRGYKIIPVLYNEFSMSDKLLKRVQYLEAKIKSTISERPPATEVK